jgi:hypothetical protein
MSQLPDRGASPALPGDPERTRKITRPPRPVGTPATPSTAPTGKATAGPSPVPVDPAHIGEQRPAVLADQPTDQLPPPPARQPTQSFGPWQPLTPRVVPTPRSRTPYVVAGLVLLVLVIGVVAVLVYG